MQKLIRRLLQKMNKRNTRFLLISNQFAKGLTLKNSLKVKQLAMQPPTLKMLIQKKLLAGI